VQHPVAPAADGQRQGAAEERGLVPRAGGDRSGAVGHRHGRAVAGARRRQQGGQAAFGQGGVEGKAWPFALRLDGHHHDDGGAAGGGQEG
jgi:hypothetical protein